MNLQNCQSEYGDFCGISVRGVYNEDDTFEMEYYYPYLCGKNISTIEPAEVEKHAKKNPMREYVMKSALE